MQVVTSPQNLVVWADPSVLAEARNTIFDVRSYSSPIPKVPFTATCPKCGVSIIYLGHA